MEQSKTIDMLQTYQGRRNNGPSTGRRNNGPYMGHRHNGPSTGRIINGPFSTGRMIGWTNMGQ